MDDNLLPHYERELALLRGSLSEFARRYPKQAARLLISGQHSEDPHVERLIQQAALQNARIGAKLDDDYAEFTESLLEITYPDYLRPFPSCSIARVEGSGATQRLTQPAVLRRGTEVKTRTGEYPFRTAYDVTLSPLRIEGARYSPFSSAPASVRLPSGTTAVISLTFATATAGMRLSGVAPATARVFVDGPQPTVAALIDALLQRASVSFVEAEGNGRWVALPAVPVSPVGFHDDEALLTGSPRDLKASFRLLFEYFAFPQKFEFLDIDLARLLRAAGPCGRLTLHVPISGLHQESAPAVAMSDLSAANFLLSCTPVINLFPCPATPVLFEEMKQPVYPLVPQTLKPEQAQVYAVDAVRLTRQTASGTTVAPVPPYDSLSHHNAPQYGDERGPVPFFWLAERDARLSRFVAGQDTLLSFVGMDGLPVELDDGEQIDADLRCTNGNRPASLVHGAAEGDLVYGDKALVGRIAMLVRPTASTSGPRETGRHWALLSMMSAGPFSLDQSGLPALKDLLRQHVPDGRQQALRQIDGIVGLCRDEVLEWMTVPAPRLVRGLRVKLTVDEQALAGLSIDTFARVLESVFVRYAPAHSFAQLVMLSAQNGSVLVRGRLMPGGIPAL
ncbi:type VI secretion system baseplate subunit TssF [Burkholderia ubonensis]|uniref:type VI secretion system baseplate subunit TssF n=1 Tax=Burkholderia ubonensis TaxID=101571 RepID=UPI0007573539|nr:type VI secretion system baseplate subunit TssF [Burkholderia ubonensis]KVN87036.1 hypothetical protein WJ67_29590 [Burkholderia ubonensis]